MRLFFKGKDGGPESKVTGYWLIEWKRVFSIVLLRFDQGSRERYHTHAFNAVSWVIRGQLLENYLGPKSWDSVYLLPSIMPFFTARNRLHKVTGIAPKTWVISFRGPWSKYWYELDRDTGTLDTLTHGRKVVTSDRTSWFY